MEDSPIVQYIIMRKDLMNDKKWNRGAIIAQSCHAAVAAIHLWYDDLDVQAYLSDLENMHKICLEVKDEQELRQLSATLTENNIKHKLWIEMPENIPTALALKPYHKSAVSAFLKALRLLK